jgi:hypothetical protein
MIAYEEREIREAWQAVANAKLIEFRRQAWRLAVLVSAGKLKMANAVDGLWEIATAHALVRSLGEDRVQAILAEAFTVARFGPQRLRLHEAVGHISGRLSSDAGMTWHGRRSEYSREQGEHPKGCCSSERVTTADKLSSRTRY